MWDVSDKRRELIHWCRRRCRQIKRIWGCGWGSNQIRKAISGRGGWHGRRGDNVVGFVTFRNLVLRIDHDPIPAVGRGWELEDHVLLGGQRSRID